MNRKHRHTIFLSILLASFLFPFKLTAGTSANDRFGNIFLLKVNYMGQEEWRKTLNIGSVGEAENCILIDVEGNLTAAGFYGIGIDEVKIVKIDQWGREEINQRIRQLNWKRASNRLFLQPHPDGGFILAGQSDRALELIKTDKYGIIQWTESVYCNPQVYALDFAPAADSGFIVFAEERRRDAKGVDLLLIKIDRQGDEIWYRRYGGDDDERGVRMLADSLGYTLLAERTPRFNRDTNILILRTDTYGEVKWSRDFGEKLQNETAAAIMTAEAGGCALLGNRRDYRTGEWNSFVEKIDSSGNEQYTADLGSAGNYYGNSLCDAANGGFIIAGYGNPAGSKDSDLWLTKIDAYGRLNWDHFYVTSHRESGVFALSLEYGECLILGEISAERRLFLTAIDEAGLRKWIKDYQTHTENFSGERIYPVPAPDHGFIIAGKTWIEEKQSKAPKPPPPPPPKEDRKPKKPPDKTND